MAFPVINTEAFSQSLSRLLYEQLSLANAPVVRVRASVDTLLMETDNISLHQPFSMFRELKAVGKGYLTNPEHNEKGTVASLEVLLTGVLHDGHETARHFASMDLLPSGEIAFIYFGDEARPALKAA